MAEPHPGGYNWRMGPRTRGESGNATLTAGVVIIGVCMVIALVQGLVVQEVGIPGLATIKFGERGTADADDHGGGSTGGATNGGSSTGGAGAGSVVEGSWVGERGEIRVEVTRAENQSGHLRLTASVTNGTGDSVTLPLFGNATAVSDDGRTYQASPQDSSFPETVASGQTASGVIEFDGLYDPGEGSLTLSFAHIFGFDAPSGSLVVSGIGRPPT